MDVQRFESVLESEGPGAFIEVPLDVPALFGRARAPVQVTVNGYRYRTTVAAYGGSYYLPVNRTVRQGAGIAVGDRVVVELEQDRGPREVEVPEDLAAALAGDAEAQSAFERLSYTHRREYAEWITEAKRPETRRRRVAETVARLHQSRPRP